MAAIRIFNDNNSVYIAGRAYQPGSLQASYTGDNVNVVQLHNSKAVIREVRYSYILDKDGNTWGSTAADTVTALNNYIGTTNPDGIIKSTNKITDLTGVTAADFASKPGYTVFVGSSDGSLQTSNAVLLDGNNLRVNGELTSSTNANLKLKPGGTGNVEIGNFEFDADQTGANDGDVLTFDSASGTIALSTPTGGGGSSPWTTSGSDIYYTTGNVGVGTTTPSQPLDVSGTVKATSFFTGTHTLQTDSNNGINLSDQPNGKGNAGVLIGHGAARFVSSVYYGTIVGPSAGDRMQNTYHVVAVGSQANSGSSSYAKTKSVGVGGESAWNGGAYNTAIGYETGRQSPSSYTNAVMAGYRAGNSGGNNSVFVGYEAGKSDGVQLVDNTVAVGYQALTALTTGGGNTAVGYQAGAALTTNGANTYLGYLAGSARTSSSNTAVGYRALTSGNSYYATAVGDRAGENGMGAYDIAIGWFAGAGVSSGGFNIKIGETAGRFHTGSHSIIIGGSSVLSSANSNIVSIGGGSNAGANTVTLGRSAGNGSSDSSVFLGYQAGSSETNSNRLYIENSNSTTPLIYGEFDNDILRVNGTLQVNDPASTGYAFPTATGTLGQVLEVDASGDLVFATPSGGGGGGLGSADQTLTADRTIDTNGFNLDIELDPTGTADTFTIHDGTHDLFQVDTGTTGTIFSVNDVSGLPKLTVDDSDGVTIDKFKEVKYEKPSNTDFSYQGDVVYFGATTGMTQGDLYYYNSSGNWAQADADAVSSSGSVLLAIALGTASDTNGMLLKGTFTMAAGAIDGTEATGDELYVSTTAGHITSDVSAYTTGDVVRVIGYCLDGTNGQIWFNPSNDWIELS